MAREVPKPEKTDEELELEVQAKLDEVNATSDPVEDLDEELAETPAEEPESKDTSTPADEAADDADDDDEPTPAEDASDETADGGVEVPDAHIRAAIHQGWTEEDVKEFVALDPERAKKVLEKLHSTTNNITTEFARLGRAEAERKKAEVEKDAPNTAVDLTALKEKYGADDPLVKIVERQQELLDTVASQKPAAPAAPADDPMRQSIDTFFGKNELKAYTDFYGAVNDPRKLTQEQYEHRFNMLTLADDILLGAQIQGRKMDVSEALDKAHMLATKDMQESVIRKEIAKSVVKRAKSLSLKPKSNKKPELSKPSDENDLVSRTEERLRILQS